MPTYKVISDLNGGKNPVGSKIELTEEQAARIPWAVEAIDGDAPVIPNEETISDEGGDADSFVITDKPELTEEQAAEEPKKKGRGKK